MKKRNARSFSGLIAMIAFIGLAAIIAGPSAIKGNERIKAVNYATQEFGDGHPPLSRNEQTTFYEHLEVGMSDSLNRPTPEQYKAYNTRWENCLSCHDTDLRTYRERNSN